MKFSCAGMSAVFKRRFPIDDFLLRSGDIRDQVAKLCEIAPKFRGRHLNLKFLTEFFNLGHQGAYVAKFGDDRPIDLGD